MRYRMWIADIDSPSYFVATAAVDLGYFADEGIDVEFVLKTRDGPELLKSGDIHFIAGPSYCAARAFPDFEGIRLLCALSQHSYWFLAVRADLPCVRGDLAALKGLKISASPGAPSLGLRHMLDDAGFDLARDGIAIVTAPAPVGDKGWMGRNGIDAITRGEADAFWGNGMRVAMAEMLGVAKLHLDLRRGDGPPGARHYNFAALTTTADLVARAPEVAEGAIRAVTRAQGLLKSDPAIATEIASRHFPDEEVPLIAGLIARDAPFYQAHISQDALAGMISFAQAQGLVRSEASVETLIDPKSSLLWEEPTRAVDRG